MVGGRAFSCLPKKIFNANFHEIDLNIEQQEGHATMFL